MGLNPKIPVEEEMDSLLQVQSSGQRGQKCILCASRQTQLTAELLDCRYLILDFECLRCTRGPGLPANATEPKPLLVELQSMPIFAVLKQIIVCSVLTKKFEERKWCLEDAKQGGLSEDTLAQIRFFGSLQVRVEASVDGVRWKDYDEEDKKIACSGELCKTELYFTIYYGDSIIISYDSVTGTARNSDIDYVGEFCDWFD